jgi:hypothetical protein
LRDNQYMRLEYIAAGARPEFPLLLIFDASPHDILQIINPIKAITRGVTDIFPLHAIPEITSLGECKLYLQHAALEENSFKRIKPTYHFNWKQTAESWSNIVEKLSPLTVENTEVVSVIFESKSEVRFIVTNNKEMDW